MGIKERFNKLIGREPAPISDREKWRRTVVRNGNLDWQGKPIDRNAGAPISGRPEQAGFFERVGDFLERAGLRVERRNEHIPQIIPNQIFDDEVGIAEQAHERRFDERSRGHGDIKQMLDYLRDGAVDGGPKRDE
jgi:hypothetical protein